MADYLDDDLGRTQTITYGNGVVTGLGYETDGDLDYINHSFVGGANNLRLDYDYNSAAQLTKTTLGNGLYHWRTASTKSQQYVPNNLNQYTSLDGVSLGYDKAGNLTQSTSGSYVYDAENKLTRAVMGASNPQGALTAVYAYDPNGRRTQKTVTPSGGASTLTEYLSDGDHEIAEYAGNSASPQKRFIYGKNVDEIIAQHDVSSSTYSYAHRNHQGSVMAVSNAGGQVSASNIYSYSPFGEPNTLTGFPYRYTGRRLDPETGLYYYRARYYDAQMGRFLQTDPVGYEDQMNLYAYVGNDPVNYADPTGLQRDPSGNRIGRMVKETFMGDAKDREKATAQNEKFDVAKLAMVESLVDMSAIGLAKDAVEIVDKVANGEDAVPQTAGAVAGEAASQVTEKVLDGFVGKDAANAAGTAVGEVVGKVVEGSAGTDGSTVQTPPPAPACPDTANCSQ